MFHRKRPDPPKSGIPESRPNPFDGLRAIALSTSADLAGFSPKPGGPVVYGAIMDWGLDRGGVATTFALADGTGSLYLSSGGGKIGGGAHEPVRQAVHSFIAAFEPFVDSMNADVDTDVPPPGFTDLRALTVRGRRVVRAATDEFGKGQHPMSPVFHAGQALIAAIRQAPTVGEMRQRPN